MKVQCGQCPAKYAVADERIRDKKVRIRCKRCNAAIVVDGKVEPPLVTSTPARKSAHPIPSVPPETFPPPEDREPRSRPSPRPVAHTIMGGLEAPAAERLREAQLSPPKPMRGANHFPMASGAGMPAADRGFTDPPAGGIANRWRVALTKQDLRWMSTSEIAEAYRAGAVKVETFVFRTGMPSWVTLLEVPEIAEALAEKPAAGGPPRRPPSSRPPPRRPAGGREEPRVARIEEARRVPDEDAGDEAPFVLGAGRANGLYTQPHGMSSTADRESNPTLPPEFIENDSPQEPLAGGPGAQASLPNDEREHAARLAPSPGVATSAHAESAALAPFAAAQQANGVGRWLWIIIAVLVVAAAIALLLGPRFGFRLL
jgi:predicted Zn finger-like uncharacterized protein